MLVEITNTKTIFHNRQFSFDQFSSLVGLHLSKVAGTQEREQEGVFLQSNNFPPNDLLRFIQNVCKWGDYPSIAGRILKQNRIGDIRACFLDAMNELSYPNLNVQNALRSINKIRQLGSTSFASKHLRFLHPDICPVLDSIISNRLGYSLNPNGYQSFSEDCLKIAQALSEHKVRNPMNRPEDKWYSADVEMALFISLDK